MAQEAVRMIGDMVLFRNGKVAMSEACCCDTCDMTAVVFVDFECPCGGYGGADDESASVTFTLVTKDGTDVMNDPWPSYITGGNGGNHIHLSGGTFDDEWGHSPYEPGENRFTYIKPCGEEIFDENSLHVTSSNIYYGGIEFSKSYDNKTHTWTYRYHIKNGQLLNPSTGELYYVERPVRIIVERGECCWSGNPADYKGELLNGARVAPTKSIVDMGGGRLVQTFDLGGSASVAVCDDEVPTVDVSAPELEAQGFAKTVDGCCKDEDTGEVFVCVSFGCAGGKLLAFNIVIDTGNCACPIWLLTWAQEVDDILLGKDARFKADITCEANCANWSQTTVSGAYPTYKAETTCCCENPTGTFSFTDDKDVTWDGADVTISGSTVTITPRIPISISIPVTYADGEPATSDDCNNLPASLTASVDGVSIVLALSGSTYMGYGGIPCGSSSPNIFITDGAGGEFVYPYPKITSVECDRYQGWIAIGEAHPARRSFTVVLVLDASDAWNGGCADPMYPINILIDGHYILHTLGPGSSTDTATDTACGPDPSSDVWPYASGQFMSAQMAGGNQPNVFLDYPSGSSQGAPYSVSWDSYTSTLTMTWKARCNIL